MAIWQWLQPSSQLLVCFVWKRERVKKKERAHVTVCLCARTHALMLPSCCVPPFSLQNSVSTNPWKLRCSEPVAKPFPTEPRPKVCTLLYTWLVPPVAGLPSLLGVGPSPSLGCSALPNRLLPTIITRAGPKTQQHTIKVWPAHAHQPSHMQHRPRDMPKTRPSSTNRAPVHAWDAPQHCGLGWCCFWKNRGGWQLCCCPPPPAEEVMCLFGLGCCRGKLWAVTISLLCCTEYQRIHPAESKPFDMWPLQTYTYNGSSHLWK